MKKGFSLIELLVVIGIVSIIVAFAAVSYSTINRRSRDTKRKADVEQLRSALEMYRSDNGVYPNTGISYANVSNLGSTLVSNYLPAIPPDPLSTQFYSYLATNNNYGYCLSAKLEGETPTNSCNPDTANSHTFGVKNP